MDFMSDDFKKMVQDDIERIDCEIKSGTQETRWDLFRELDGRYQVCISDFYKGMWESSHDGSVLYFPRLKTNSEYLLDNLKLVRSKLYSLKFGANATCVNSLPSTTVNVNNNVNVEISFEQVSEYINNLTSLTSDETNEILERVKEIEKIVGSEENKKGKWERIRPILGWLADKSFDVGMAILPLILKIK